MYVLYLSSFVLGYLLGLVDSDVCGPPVKNVVPTVQHTNNFVWNSIKGVEVYRSVLDGQEDCLMVLDEYPYNDQKSTTRTTCIANSYHAMG
mmetsp:Transcript_19887/g.29755  ORF Transcript_19887/g.29755 Transcript_19887/m.29755 type:complete len:91 (-) Transcript_19887:765-1037(-)